MKRFLSILLVLTVSLTAAAQDNDAFSVLYGKVTDSQSGAPVSYASVTLTGTNISNVTNADGIFSLKVPALTEEKATVTLHHLGYLNAVRPVSDFLGATPAKPLPIVMTPMSIELDPALIRSVDPETLLWTAYRHVRDNYPQKHEHLVAFYREMIRKGSSKYLALNEAVVDIDKAPYGTSFYSDRASIFKGRGSKDFHASDTLFVHFQGGIVGTLLGDVVKDPFVGCDLDRVSHCYTLSVDGSAVLDGHECFILRFKEIEDPDYILYDGCIYIDTQTYAIARAEYSLNVKGREEKASSRFVVRKPAGWRCRVEKATYQLNFKQSNGLWHFDYSRMELLFNAKSSRTLFSHNYTVVSEMAVTDRKDEVFKITGQEKVKFSDILSEKVNDFADPAFWGSYNIIEPDQSIEAAIRRIRRQLKARN